MTRLNISTIETLSISRIGSQDGYWNISKLIFCSHSVEFLLQETKPARKLDEILKNKSKQLQ
ncbi:MAG: hypothetical protein K2K32_04560 [Muribaculaceae bacterium]|nr:hypothetical protein [Muribaculaceae bacterium]